jgi:hypothetical protein
MEGYLFLFLPGGKNILECEIPILSLGMGNLRQTHTQKKHEDEA